MTVSLDTLLATAPYLADLHQRHGDWLETALPAPDAALADIRSGLAASGRDTADEATIARELRLAKQRVALLAAAAEVTGGWTPAQSTAALADLVLRTDVPAELAGRRLTVTRGRVSDE